MARRQSQAPWEQHRHIAEEGFIEDYRIVIQ